MDRRHGGLVHGFLCRLVRERRQLSEWKRRKLRPNSLSNEYRNWAAGGDYLHWEGQQQDIYFSDSGVTVQTHIDSDAQSRAFTAYAGWAQRTSDGKVFNCYKDNGRQLFQWAPPVPDGTNRAIICNAIYWCV
ncbi:hypothetical protein FRC00_010007 [Tulasnella sp. 408]|nr:hypothetical protein FRC00_010007 [Tulasnella sp. 408]